MGSSATTFVNNESALEQSRELNPEPSRRRVLLNSTSSSYSVSSNQKLNSMTMDLRFTMPLTARISQLNFSPQATVYQRAAGSADYSSFPGRTTGRQLLGLVLPVRKLSSISENIPIFEVVFRPSRALAPVVLRVVCLRTRVVTPVAGAHLTTDQCSTTSLRICSVLASSYRAALRAFNLRSRVSQTLCER